MSDYRPTPVLRFVERRMNKNDYGDVTRVLQQRWERPGKLPELKTAQDYFTKGMEPIPPEYEWRDVRLETESA